jgi:hypothetical protein
MQVSIMQPRHIGQNGRGIGMSDGSGGYAIQTCDAPIRRPLGSEHAALNCRLLFTIDHMPIKMPADSENLLGSFLLKPGSPRFRP